MTCISYDGETENVDWEGKLVVVPLQGYTRVDEVSYTISSYENYLIKDGIPRRTIPIKIVGGSVDALSKIILLNEDVYDTGMCGKGDPVTGSDARVPVSEFSKIQLWPNQTIRPINLGERNKRILKKEFF